MADYPIERAIKAEYAALRKNRDMHWCKSFLAEKLRRLANELDGVASQAAPTADDDIELIE